MKRLFILAAVLFSLNAVVSAQDYGFLGRLNEKSTYNGLVRYLNADYEQQNYLREIFDLSSQKYSKAIKGGNASEEAMKKVLSFNLSNTKHVLSPEQYKKYLMVINMTNLNGEQAKFLASAK